ncbi:MAG: HEAT repeat domain-containing protein [Cytophagales bacterium]|nr:HEAT repeat domain-containing protein [Cytophagales bacterium]
MIEQYKEALLGDDDDRAIEASGWFANHMDDEAFSFLEGLLASEDEFVRDVAAVTLAKSGDERTVEPLFEAIHKKENENTRGVLVGCLETFEIDSYFVDVFKLFLFGNFKVSAFALDLLNHKSFDIRQRTLKKASKALHHYSHNIGKDDEAAQGKLQEGTEILKEIEELLQEEGEA